MNFESLANHISVIQDTLQAQAAHSVNLALTSRNWLMGYYIIEFEQRGEDRAAYGEQLLKKLEKRLHTKGLNERALVTENDLEQSILDNLQNFLIEMGHGFCFEARQKRILIDEDYFFAPKKETP